MVGEERPDVAEGDEATLAAHAHATANANASDAPDAPQPALQVIILVCLCDSIGLSLSRYCSSILFPYIITTVSHSGSCIFVQL